MGSPLAADAPLSALSRYVAPVVAENPKRRCGLTYPHNMSSFPHLRPQSAVCGGAALIANARELVVINVERVFPSSNRGKVRRLDAPAGGSTERSLWGGQTPNGKPPLGGNRTGALVSICRSLWRACRGETMKGFEHGQAICVNALSNRFFVSPRLTRYHDGSRPNPRPAN